MAATPAFLTVHRNWNSLQRLKIALIVLAAADLLFLLALLAGQNQHRSLLQTIGKDSVPSIIAAQHIKVAIADMDAEAANELLAKPGEGKTAAEAYDARREEAAEALITAAQNITYGDAEREPIKELQIGLGEYETRIQRARDFHERNDALAIKTYREATAIVSDKLFTAAQALDEANRKVLNKTFETDRTNAILTRGAAISTGLVLLALLIFIQWELTQTVRRLLNPALLVASILTLGLVSFASGHLSAAAENLRSAKEDAFTSLHALWQARASAFAANADESKYLLPDGGSWDESAFFQKTAKILERPENSSGTPQSANGYLGVEMANITFPGEREAAEETINTWQTYMKIDSRIRQLKLAKNYDDALRLCLGKKPGQSDWAFSQFDDVLMRTIQINQDAFDKSVAAGFDQLAKFDLIATIGAAAIAICCFLGLLVRIREYL